MRRGRVRGAGDVRLDRRALGAGRRARSAPSGSRRSGSSGVGLYRIMPTPPAFLTAQALVDAGVDAAVAQHDLAGHLGRVERADEAQFDLGRVGAGQTRRSPSRSAATTARPGRRRRRCTWRRCPASPTWWTGPVVGARGDGRVPRAVVRDACSAPGRCCRPTRRRTRPPPRRGRTPISIRSTIESGRAGDRVVDHVDAVGDRVVDRGHDLQRRCHEPSVALVADLVRGDARRRRHAAGPADLDAVDDGGDVVVAGRGAGGVRCRGRRSRAASGTPRRRLRTAPKSYQRAPISLLLQVTGSRRLVAGLADAVPLGGDHVGVRAAARAGPRSSGSPARRRSRSTPTMTPSPARVGSPNWRFHAPPAPSRPEEPRGADRVELEDLVLPELDDARRVCCSFATSAAVSFAATPLSTVSYSATCLALVDLGLAEHLGALGLQVLAVGAVVPGLGGRASRRSPAWCAAMPLTPPV